MLTAPKRILPILVLAQFAGTSLWFAVNAVMPDLQQQMGWPASAVGRLTSALQLGFIVGTLVFALLAIADRFSSRRVFLFCALAGALCTLGALMRIASFTELLLWRAATGFFLAGIYPVGMKIASQWFPEGLGVALGWLVGALVLGSASAHGIRALSVELPWSTVMISVALLAAAGGLILFMVIPEPPNYTASTKKLEWQALATIWTDWRVRASVLGYFGHMWELYTFWVLVPLILATQLNGQALSFAAFVVLGIGAVGCIGGGWLAKRWGSARVATLQLSMSGICCLLAPWLMSAPLIWFLLWLAIWGMTAAGDSPQFSTLTASNAPKQAVGSVLTLTNCIGFALSIVSIELFTSLAQEHQLASLLPWLGIGPLLGIVAMRPLLGK
ncbi:MAG: MFS transporter [Limnohabitans sp.]|nr:MFS transporter [Limnohabitans sp.]